MLVWYGDKISLDIPGRRLDLLVDETEPVRRNAAWQPLPARFLRGCGTLFAAYVTQAKEGRDFDLLEGMAPTAGTDIH